MSSVTLPAAPAAPEAETHDFHGFTAPWAVPGQDVSRASKVLLDAWLDSQPQTPHWSETYEMLMRELDQDNKPRWDWRKALFIAWNALPTKLRWPETKQGLVDLLGLRNDATIRHWRKNDPEIDKRIAEVRVQLVDNAVSDLIQAAIDCGLNDGPQGFQDRQMLLKITKVLVPTTKTEISGPDGGPVHTVAELSDDDLLHIATSGS